MWSSFAYNLGGHVFSLDEMEHGILRANAPHPSGKRLLPDEADPRLKLAMKELDFRIHFALNCGAKSCPPIRLFFRAVI